MQRAAVDQLRIAKTHYANPDPYLMNNYTIDIRVRLVQEMLGDVRNCRILDLGCGDGRVSLQFLQGNNHVTLVDSSARMLEQARRNTPPGHAGRVRYVQADVLSFEPDAPFDVVLCIGVLAHLTSTSDALAKVASCLAREGRCVLQLTDDANVVYTVNRWLYAARRSVLERLGHTPLRFTRMSLANVVAIASQHGLAPIARRRHLLLLFPGMRNVMGRWFVPYDLFVQKSAVLSRLAEDVILMCRFAHP